MCSIEDPHEPTISGRFLERLSGEGRLQSVLAARPPGETTLEVALARQLAHLPNGEAVLRAMASEFESRIRFRIPAGRRGIERTDLESQLLATSARFFERVAMRRASILRAVRSSQQTGESPPSELDSSV